MNIEDAIKKAESQINKCRYLRDCSPGVYETGLNVAYKNKSEMLAQLVGGIKQLRAENERLKAEKPVRCGECKHIEKTLKNEPYYPGAEKYRCECIKCGKPTRVDSFCQLGERRDAE